MFRIPNIRMLTRLVARRFSYTGVRSIASDTHYPLLQTPASLYELSSGSDKLSIIDATWVLPNSTSNPRTQYLSRRLPGAHFFDQDLMASSNELGLTHMMPSSQMCALLYGQFRIGPDTHVVIYDTHGVFSSPRALFMFRAVGHTKSSILNGGLPRWQTEGYPVQGGPPSPIEHLVCSERTLDNSAIRNYEQMVANSKLSDSAAELVLDARSRRRFRGLDPEPRPGISSGHIPNSHSLPFDLFLEKHTTPDGSATYTTLLSPKAIRQALVDAVGTETAELIIKGEKQVVTTCGSGMTACVLWLGLKLLGVERIALYDESWAGYAMRKESVVIKET